MSHFWQAILKLLRSILSSLGGHVSAMIEPAYKTVSAIKSLLDSDAVDFITALTAADLDDAIVKHIRGVLPQILATLGCYKKTLDIENENERMRAFVEQVSKQPEPIQNAVWLKLASALVQNLSDGELKQWEADFLVQLYHTNTRANEHWFQEQTA